MKLMKPVFENDYQYKVNESKRPKKSKKSISTSFKSLEIDWCGYSPDNNCSFWKKKNELNDIYGSGEKTMSLTYFILKPKYGYRKKKI